MPQSFQVPELVISAQSSLLPESFGSPELVVLMSSVVRASRRERESS